MWGIDNNSRHVVRNDVSRTSGTVVIEEIVTVGLVLGSRIYHESQDNTRLLVIGEVQHLFRYLASPVFVVPAEWCQWRYA